MVADAVTLSLLNANGNLEVALTVIMLLGFSNYPEDIPFNQLKDVNETVQVKDYNQADGAPVKKRWNLNEPNRVQEFSHLLACLKAVLDISSQEKE